MRILHIRSILSALLLSLALPLVAHAQVGIGLSVTIAPPEIPVYEQPPIPGDGYIWTPGFWQWGPDGYYWVPGTWVQPPTFGVLWTPGYWGWGEGVYLFHPGYWGPHVGFYGGVNYGFGYGGSGFEGGYWRGNRMYYNRAVMNVSNVHITNVYNKTVIVNNTTRVSFNGGAGGVRAEPTRTELAAVHERHIEPTPMQTQHIRAASSNRALLASENHGAPAIAATPKPGVFAGKGVVSAHPASAMHTETHVPVPAAVPHAAPETHGAVTHPTARPPATGPAAERPEAKTMTAHPAAPVTPHPAAAPPHPAAPVAPHPAAPVAPHPAAPVAPRPATPPPPVQQHAAPAPRANPQGPQGHEDKRD